MESETTEIYVLDGMAQEALAMDIDDEELALELFELMGTNHEIVTAQATVEEFSEKLARRSKR